MTDIIFIHPFKPIDANGFIHEICIKNRNFYNKPKKKEDNKCILRDWIEIRFEYEYGNTWNLVYFPVFDSPIELGQFTFPLTAADYYDILTNTVLKKYKKMFKSLRHV